MDNVLFVAGTLIVSAVLGGLIFLIELARRRRIRPGFCHSCNQNPVKPGQIECGECWEGKQW